jgi:type I restriction-modification system DNA methylase subunit
VYYTPRTIVATLVGETFDSLPDSQQAKILDPACGAGVFLLFAFLRVYRERSKQTGSRPKTEAIRSILEIQLTGFDISESGLKFAALSLYSTAIELDPSPVPPEKLKFKDLSDTFSLTHGRLSLLMRVWALGALANTWTESLTQNSM